MRIVFLLIGKTDRKAISDLWDDYIGRLSHYLPVDVKIVPDVRKGKNLDPETQKRVEGEALLSLVEPSDFVWLTDEKGDEYTSESLATLFQKRMSSGLKRLVFIVGGPYGHSEAVYHRANACLSLSKLTFSHQLIRPFLAEQCYRAMTILRGEPYHHT